MFDSVQMQQVWQVEQEILDVFHSICVQYNLKYSLAYGTLIGAVRHKGFIPWDDDIDVMMPREDYEKLLALWPEVAPAGYLLQNHETNPDYMQSFSKILKDHTTYLQEEWAQSKNYHKGFFIDIFPGDRVAPTPFQKKLQFGATALALLYTRNHISNSRGLRSMGERVLLCLPRRLRSWALNRAESYVQKWNGNANTQYIFPCTIRACKQYHSAALFDALIPMVFNEKEYCATQAYDLYLRTQYGDYMQLPPEEDRVWKHHPILIDFEHNYEELIHE